MGAVGYYISERSVFFVTAALTLPAVVAILPIARFSNQPFPEVERRSPARLPRKERIGRVLGDRRLLIFAGFVMLATLANAALLPLAGSAITKRAADAASLVIAASIVLPQLIMALISPAIGRIAEARGRRPILLLGSAMFPVRGVLLAVTTDPSLVVLFQLLDGIAAACFGVMVPLVTADITGRSGHLNLALGFVGFAMGIGATLSTTVAGWIADHYGDPAAFAALAFAGLAGLALVWLAMPETRPAER
jgi:MFS family permease